MENLNLFPIKLEQVGSNQLKIIWNDQKISLYKTYDLRIKCRCASCIDEWSGQNRLDTKTISPDVHPIKIQPVGRYAVQIYWSDGHSTGIYTFDYLRSLIS